MKLVHINLFKDTRIIVIMVNDEVVEEQGSEQEQCLFCKISKKEVNSYIVYEDGLCIAVLDINPVIPGHVLLYAKEHAAVIPQINPKTFAHVLKITRKLSFALLKGLKAVGTTIYAANGYAAGQVSPHHLIHLIPRYVDDGAFIDFPKTEQKDYPESRAQLKEIFSQLKNMKNKK